MQADRFAQPEMQANGIAVGNDTQAFEEHLLAPDARKEGGMEEKFGKSIEAQENPDSVEMEDSSSIPGLRNGEEGQNGSDGEEEDEEEQEEEQEDEHSEAEASEREGSEADSDEENDYEAQRRRNIERNQEMLRQLGLLASPAGTLAHSNGDQSTSLTSSSQPDALSTAFVITTPKRKYKPRQKRNIDTPTRTSSRLQTKSRRSYAENSFFKTLSPEEQARVLAEEKKARKKAKKAAAEAAENDEELKAARNQNKWVGSRLYDSDRGITCHQCRQKTVDEKSTCANEFRCHSPSRHHYCRQCLWNRYGEALDEVRKDPTWLCPSCRGVCNCSFCRKKRGQAPTGVLDPTILQKYSSVAEYLEKGRKEKPAIPEEELRKMKEQIAREIEQGIRPSAPVPTSSRQAGEIDGEAKEGHFYVEAIVEHRTTPTGLEYLIKWLGYDYEANTWEPAVHLNCPHLIKEYHIRHKLPLVGKRGRKKKTVATTTTSTTTTTATTAAGTEGDGEDEEKEEEEEEEEEEEVIEEWQTRRPGRPKGRGIGAPRLVMGTGRGPRGAAGQKPAGEADGRPKAEEEPEVDGEKDQENNNSEDEAPVETSARGRKRKVRDQPTASPQRGGGKARATKKSKREAVVTKAKAKSKTKAKAKVKEAIKKLVTRATTRKTASSKKADVVPTPPKGVRKSPRRKTAATDGDNDESSPTVAMDAKEQHRKSPRLAKRASASKNDRRGKTSAVAVAEDRRARRSRKLVASDNEEQEEAEQADKAGSEDEDGKEEPEHSEKPATNSPYWDEPVEKGRRRRSAPLLLTDNLVILGNGQMRGAWTGKAAQKRKANDKKSTAKDVATKAGKKSGSAKRKRKRSEDEEEEKEEEERQEKEARTAKKHGRKAKKTEKTTGGKSKRKHDEQEGKESEREEQGNNGADEEQKEEEEDEEGQTLYWERPVPGKRRRAPNMAYFSDFVVHDARVSSKRSRPAVTEG